MKNMDVTSATLAGPNSTVAETQQTRSTPTHLDRQQILDATALSLREFGYDKTTIRRIAKLLDCAVGSIYRYFKDKRELLFAVTQQTLEPVRDMLQDGGTYRESISAYHEIATTDPVSYRLMFWLSSLGLGDGTLPPIVHELFAQWAKHLGSDASVHRDFASLHGLLALGADLDQVLATVGGDPDAQSTHSSQGIATPANRSDRIDITTDITSVGDRPARPRETTPSYATQAKVREDGELSTLAQPKARPDIEGIMPRPDAVTPTPSPAPVEVNIEPTVVDTQDDVCLL